jgi:hypothetical protein
MASDTATQLANKLSTEGERTTRYFSQLNEAAWSQSVYADGSHWNVRQVFEHMITSEEKLLDIFKAVAAGKGGSVEALDVDAANARLTGALSALASRGVLAQYAETRATTVAWIRRLTDSQLAARGRHPAMGETTLEEMLKMIYLHNQMHVRDVKRTLAG